MRAARGVILALALLPATAFAQEASVKETRCWVGDVTFSPGAGINAGSGAAICEAGRGWKEAEAGAPIIGCLLEGELSSVGAVVGIRNSDHLLIQCDASGRWMTIDGGDQG